MERRRLLLGPRELIHRTRPVAAFTLLVTLFSFGCGHRGHGEDTPELSLKEASATGYYLPDDAEGVGFSAGVVNETGRPLEITAVHVDADPALTVTYIGWATCAHGCFGTDSWTDIRESNTKGQMVPEGTLPVPVPAKGAHEGGGFAPTSLEFRVVLDPRLLGDPKPCYRVRRITVDLRSGPKKVPVEYPDGSPPFAVQARDTTLDPDCTRPARNGTAISGSSLT